MNLKLTMLLPFVIGTLFLNAQFAFKDQFMTKDLKAAKTIIILKNDVDPGLENGNVWLDDAVRKYWKATPAELATAKYGEVRKAKTTGIYIGIIRTINEGLYEDKGPEGMTVYTLTFLSAEGSAIKFEVKHPRIYLNRDFTELDIIYAVRLLNSYAEASIKGIYDNSVRVATSQTPPLYRLSELNKGKLKGKILLIDKELLGKKTDEATVKEAYTYPVKLATKEEIQEAVKNKDSKYAYVQSSMFYLDYSNTSMGFATAPVVVDAETGNMLSYSKITSIATSMGQFNPKRAEISKSNLKEIMKNAE